MSAPIQIGILVFPKVTQLDFTGPLQVFSSLPGANVHLIWKRIEPVTSDSVLTLTPTMTFADCPQLDVICVPGGAGTDDMVNDEEMLDFLRRQAKGAKYITSVCTGSLVLGAAGLLTDIARRRIGRRWNIWRRSGRMPTKTRVCVDRNRITGGGVTAGIDFALTLVSILVDRQTAEAIQFGSNITPHRRSIPARPIPRRRKCWRAQDKEPPMVTRAAAPPTSAPPPDFNDACIASRTRLKPR